MRRAPSMAGFCRAGPVTSLVSVEATGDRSDHASSYENCASGAPRTIAVGRGKNDQCEPIQIFLPYANNTRGAISLVCFAMGGTPGQIGDFTWSQ